MSINKISGKIPLEGLLSEIKSIESKNNKMAISTRPLVIKLEALFNAFQAASNQEKENMMNEFTAAAKKIETFAHEDYSSKGIIGRILDCLKNLLTFRGLTSSEELAKKIVGGLSNQARKLERHQADEIKCKEIFNKVVNVKPEDFSEIKTLIGETSEFFKERFKKVSAFEQQNLMINLNKATEMLTHLLKNYEGKEELGDLKKALMECERPTSYSKKNKMTPTMSAKALLSSYGLGTETKKLFNPIEGKNPIVNIDVNKESLDENERALKELLISDQFKKDFNRGFFRFGKVESKKVTEGPPTPAEIEENIKLRTNFMYALLDKFNATEILNLSALMNQAVLSDATMESTEKVMKQAVEERLTPTSKSAQEGPFYDLSLSKEGIVTLSVSSKMTDVYDNEKSGQKTIEKSIKIDITVSKKDLDVNYFSLPFEKTMAPSLKAKQTITIKFYKS